MQCKSASHATMHVHAYDQRGPVVKAVVTVAIAVSAVLFAAFYLWFRPDWWIALLYACICLLAIVSVPLLYRLFGYVDIDAIRELQQLEQKDHDEMMGRLSNLKQKLSPIDSPGKTSARQPILMQLEEFRIRHYKIFRTW